MQDIIAQIKTFLEYHQASYGSLRFPSEQKNVTSTNVVRPNNLRTSETEKTRVSPALSGGPDKSVTIPADLSMPPGHLVDADTVAQSLHPGSPYHRINNLIPSGHPALHLATLDDLRAFVASNAIIPIDETRTNPVFGVGKPDADLMIIGEAPGRDEDLQGEPFVGKAGQLLNKILRAIQFERTDVYIANILKSRPPGNRDPKPDEVAAHLPFLYRQIALIQPKIILCLGKVSANTLLASDRSLSSMRQTDHSFHGIPMMITYHPAALLRNPQWKRATWEDVQKLREQYDQLVSS